MAVFFINVCKFDRCGVVFQTLGDLIQHIEEVHIDYDPQTLEKQELKQPSCLPLSYVLQFYTEAAQNENAEAIKKKQIKLTAIPTTVTAQNSVTAGSEQDEEETYSESDDSNDSWNSCEAFGTNYIMKVMNGTKETDDKPFACPIPGCKKRYKNVNGVKYHTRNGHRKCAKAKEEFKCHCGKCYKTALGLKNHSITHQTTTSISSAAVSFVSSSVVSVMTSTNASSSNCGLKATADVPAPILVDSVTSPISSSQLAAALSQASTQKEVLQVMSIAAMHQIPKSPSVLFPIVSSQNNVSSRSVQIPICLPISPVSTPNGAPAQIQSSLIPLTMPVTPIPSSSAEQNSDVQD